MTTSQHTSSFTTDGPCRYAFQASHPQEATDRLAGMHGAEGATGSSLGQAKRSPRSQATYGIGPEGTEERRSRVPSLQDGHVGGFYPGAELRLPQATSYRASGACCAHYASQITVSTGAMFQTGQLSESKHTTGTQSSRRNNGLGGYNVQQAEWQASLPLPVAVEIASAERAQGAAVACLGEGRSIRIILTPGPAPGGGVLHAQPPNKHREDDAGRGQHRADHRFSSRARRIP